MFVGSVYEPAGQGGPPALPYPCMSPLPTTPGADTEPQDLELMAACGRVCISVCVCVPLYTSVSVKLGGYTYVCAVSLPVCAECEMCAHTPVCTCGVQRTEPRA